MVIQQQDATTKVKFCPEAMEVNSSALTSTISALSSIKDARTIATPRVSAFRATDASVSLDSEELIALNRLLVSTTTTTNRLLALPQTLF